MRIDVLGDDAISPQARTYAEYRVFAALSQLADGEQVHGARVVLRRANGSGASDDVTCIVTVALAGSSPLRVRTTGNHPYAAINRAVERLRSPSNVNQLSRIRPAVDFSERARGALHDSVALRQPEERRASPVATAERPRPAAPLTQTLLEVGTRADAERELTRRVQAEYAEMPGLSLTLSQAQRLWGVDRRTCESAFGTLIAHGFLRMTGRGRFVRR